MANIGVIPLWLLIIFAPNQKLLKHLVNNLLFHTSSFYLWLLSIRANLSFDSLNNVAQKDLQVFNGLKHDPLDF